MMTAGESRGEREAALVRLADATCIAAAFEELASTTASTTAGDLPSGMAEAWRALAQPPAAATSAVVSPLPSYRSPALVLLPAPGVWAARS